MKNIHPGSFQVAIQKQKVSICFDLITDALLEKARIRKDEKQNLCTRKVNSIYAVGEQKPRWA